MKEIVPEKVSFFDDGSIPNPFPFKGEKSEYESEQATSVAILDCVRKGNLQGARALVKNNVGMTEREAEEAIYYALQRNNYGPEFVRLLLDLGAHVKDTELKKWLTQALLAGFYHHPDVIALLNRVSPKDIAGLLHLLKFSESLSLCKPEYNHYRNLYKALGIILTKEIEYDLAKKNSAAVNSSLMQALGFSAGRSKLPLRKSALEKWLPQLNEMAAESRELWLMPNSAGRTFISYLQELDLKKFPHIAALAGVSAEQPKKTTVKDAEEGLRRAIADLDFNDALPLDVETVKAYLKLIDDDYIFESSARDFLLQKNAKGFSLLYYLLNILRLDLELHQFRKKIGPAFSKIRNRYLDKIILPVINRHADNVEADIKQGQPICHEITSALILGKVDVVNRLAKYTVMLNEEERNDLLLRATTSQRPNVDCVHALIKTGNFVCPPDMQALFEEEVSEHRTPEQLVATVSDSPTRSTMHKEAAVASSVPKDKEDNVILKKQM